MAGVWRQKRKRKTRISLLPLILKCRFCNRSSRLSRQQHGAVCSISITPVLVSYYCLFKAPVQLPSLLSCHPSNKALQRHFRDVTQREKCEQGASIDRQTNSLSHLILPPAIPKVISALVGLSLVYCVWLVSPLIRQLNKSGEENWPDPIFPYFPEPHNAISETDWQKLWQNAENSAGHNKLDPNGSEVTDPPGYEESEVSTDLLMGTGADRRATNRPEDEQSPACSRSIDVCMCSSL